MTFEPPADFDFWVAVGTIALAAVTGVLALFSLLALREARVTRLASQRPSFVIEPVIYDPEGNATDINLVNTGQTASNIEAICMALDSPTGSGDSFTHHIMSLSREGRAVIEIPMTLLEMKQKGKYLKIEINCKDNEGRDFHSIISFNYGKIKDTSVRVGYQYNVDLRMLDAIKRIDVSIRKIREKFTGEPTF